MGDRTFKGYRADVGLDRPAGKDASSQGWAADGTDVIPLTRRRAPTRKTTKSGVGGPAGCDEVAAAPEAVDPTGWEEATASLPDAGIGSPPQGDDEEPQSTE